MAASKIRVMLVLLFVCGAVYLVNGQFLGSRGTCWKKGQCSGVADQYYKTIIDWIELSIYRFCCPNGSSRFFTVRNSVFRKPICTCHFDIVRTTSCWRGEQCCGCLDDGDINGVPVCCPFCRAPNRTVAGVFTRNLRISGNSCSCNN